MRKVLHERSRVVAYIITGVFIIGLPLVFVPGSPLARRRPEEKRPGDESEVVARVNGEPVTRGRLDQRFAQITGQLLSIYQSIDQPVGFDQIWPLRVNAMEQAIAQELLLQEGEAEKVSVSRQEVRARAEQVADEELARLKGQFSPKELEVRLGQVVSMTDERRRERVSERWFREWLVKRMLSASERLREELVLEKLRQMTVRSVTATEEDLLATYDRATVREIQVLLRPPEGTERTEEEARERTEELAARAKGGEDFAGLARKESDDGEGAKKGGLIESTGRGMMPREWEEGVFGLGPDEISDPIKLPWGYAVVKMEGVERKLPEDFETTKGERLRTLAQQKQSEAWGERQEKLREKAEVEVVDPELQAWQALQEGKVEEALAGLQEATSTLVYQDGLGPATAFYQLGALLERQEEWEAAIDAYESSDGALARGMHELPGGRAEALISVGRCYERLADREEALDWYRAASDAADARWAHEKLRGIYQGLGETELAAREQERIEEYLEAERERQQQLAEMAREKEGEEPMPEEAGGEAPASRAAPAEGP